MPGSRAKKATAATYMLQRYPQNPVHPICEKHGRAPREHNCSHPAGAYLPTKALDEIAWRLVDLLHSGKRPVASIGSDKIVERLGRRQRRLKVGEIEIPCGSRE